MRYLLCRNLSASSKPCLQYLESTSGSGGRSTLLSLIRLSLLISMLVPATCNHRHVNTVYVKTTLLMKLNIRLNIVEACLYLQHCEDVVILRTDVAVATEWRHCHCVGVEDGEIIRVSSINHSDASVPGGQPAREDWNKCTC